MSKKEMLQQQIGMARMVVEGTLSDVTADQVAHVPPGIAHPIGALYAHDVMSEDTVVNFILRQQPPLFESTFKGKTGVSAPMPAFGEPGMNEWARSVKVDMLALKEYAKAVHTTTDDYVAGLTDSDLDKKMEFGGMGSQSIANIITLLAIVHPSNHIGEVSALKGIGGGKGYPF